MWPNPTWTSTARTTILIPLIQGMDDMTPLITILIIQTHDDRKPASGETGRRRRIGMDDHGSQWQSTQEASSPDNSSPLFFTKRKPPPTTAPEMATPAPPHIPAPPPSNRPPAPNYRHDSTGTTFLQHNDGFLRITVIWSPVDYYELKPTTSPPGHMQRQTCYTISSLLSRTASFTTGTPPALRQNRYC
jgi:hypothetical protein